jgi:putative addiction module component (TIGR02574 family)
MSERAEQLIREALSLPLPEILDLMDRLEEHVEPLLAPPETSQLNMDPEWNEEIRRRIEDFESGKTKLVSTEELFASLREESEDDSDSLG